METQRNKSLFSHENRGMTKSHSSTSSLNSVPRLPPIDSVRPKQIELTEEMRSRLNRLLEVGKSDIMLSTSKVVEQARLAESKITSRLESLSGEMLSVVENVVREKENELAEMRAQCEGSEGRFIELLDRERGLVEQQSQLSIELVMEKRGRQASDLQVGELKLLVAELRVKLEETLRREDEKKDNDLKTKSELSGKMKEYKTEIANLQKQLQEGQEKKKKEIESSKQDSNSKHGKESMRLHQDVNKWKLKCEKTCEEVHNLKKDLGKRDEEMMQEKGSWEDKFKQERGQHKEEVTALETKLGELNIRRGAEVSSRDGIIQKFQMDVERLKDIYNEAMQQITVLKRNLEEYENPQEDLMESSRIRLLRAQNQREKAKLEQEKRDASKKINRAFLKSNPKS